MLLIWNEQANAAGVERSRALFEEWVEKQPGDAAVLIVVPGKRTRAPDDETLESMQRTANSPIPQCKGMATLVEVEGFIAASVHAVMMRLHAITARPDAAQVFGSTHAAARWASLLLSDPGITSGALAQALRESREG